jgi:quinoprotein glucose dehydrogenase
MITGQGSADPFLRHCGVMALTGCAKPEQLAALADHAVPAVRLSAVLALRRLKHEGIASFLADADPVIAGEAVRAIVDVPIPAARPALRETARRLTLMDAPVFLTNDLQFRRVLRSLQVEGNAAAASALASLAATGTLSEQHRRLALLTLQNFVNPPPVDPTNGLWRPLPPRDAAMVRTAVAATLGKVLDEAPGEVKAPALTLSVTLGLPVALEKLTAWTADAAQPAVLRLSALAQLPPAQALGFATHDLPELRAAAARQAATAFPDKAAGLAGGLIQRASATDLLAAYHILGTVATPASAALLAAELDRLSAGNVPEPLRLDLLEAASLRPEPELKAKLAAYEASLAKAGQSIYDLTLQGGDPARGREVFANQGTCLKCHRAEGEGGSAGPRLTGLALISQPAQMLESVLYPNNRVVPGFGISVVTLQDGTVLVGTVMAETAESLTLRTAEGESKAVAKSTIKEQLPPVSPMPPVGLSLTKRDLRDLMAFLRSLTTPLPVLK